ncbi:hypothetical protein Raf01_41310 [Rugosimonospora africana]|uniref:Uncharacterized protein n=1 Tax=Rugosimonospora africana TaxID=556532 RepID=A0A8J3QT40_9ACTN|nr:hypothetical protein Raf01_41310 [Rugosimonospora africana]
MAAIGSSSSIAFSVSSDADWFAEAGQRRGHWRPYRVVQVVVLRVDGPRRENIAFEAASLADDADAIKDAPMLRPCERALRGDR